MTVGVAGMWTEKDPVYMAADTGKLALQFFMDIVEAIKAECTCGKTWLIGDHGHPIIGMVESCDCLQAAGQCLPAIGGVDAAFLYTADHAVSAEYDDFHCSISRNSETRIRPLTMRDSLCISLSIFIQKA